MSIDLSQFHQVFFEESFEGLDVMESSLLELDITDVDAEVINNILRAAHSIKGGTGTFGFQQVSEFTHVLETLLDELTELQEELSPHHWMARRFCPSSLSSSTYVLPWPSSAQRWYSYHGNQSQISAICE